MAELLVWNVDKKRAPEDFEPGDVISVFPDGQLGPHAHCNGKFAVIKIPGVKPAELSHLLEGPEIDDGKREVQRLERVDMEALSAKAKEELISAAKTCTLKDKSEITSLTVDRRK
jgi:hypothetical protein